MLVNSVPLSLTIIAGRDRSAIARRGELDAIVGQDGCESCREPLRSAGAECRATSRSWSSRAVRQKRTCWCGRSPRTCRACPARCALRPGRCGRSRWGMSGTCSVWACHLQPLAAARCRAAGSGGACEVRDRRLQGVEAVVQRQERVSAEGEDDRFLLDAHTVDLASLGPGRTSAVLFRLRHLATVFWLMP